MAKLHDRRIKAEDTALVGFEGTHYYVPRANLVGRGARLSGALATVVEDGEVPIAKLDAYTSKHSNDTIRTYITYLKSGNIEPVNQHNPGDEAALLVVDIEDIVKGYLLARALDDVKGQHDYMNATLSTYRDKSTPSNRWLPQPELVIEVYWRTVRGCPMRKLMVDVHVWAGRIGVLDSFYRGNPFDEWAVTDFLTELSAALDQELPERVVDILHTGVETKFRLRDDSIHYLASGACERYAAAILPDRLFTDLTPCDYHVHAVGEPCPCENAKRKHAAEDEDDEPHRRPRR
ncbi:hypothetical protein Slin15195_G124340 [Septoria linicola]|uniref:Uncharacterized protein n=1 Tax=Septoria linicola TaxID=215465 RepID=A0A9Q9EQG8_9PEZI|nr:hypothetical protein Slin14017_G080550 [Septoria linicola]USW59115.1 hypothetical protein Slin15195_G124340 [Septoria linicola]